MEDREGISQRQRRQIERVERLSDSDDDDRRRNIGQSSDNATVPDPITFNTRLPSLHTYLGIGEVEDTHQPLTFLDVGGIHELPLFYFEGVVIFPEAMLPLRVVDPTFSVLMERELSQIDQGTPLIIGVVRLILDTDGTYRLAKTGTTAEIHQYTRLEDGSINVVTRGQQRFRMEHFWDDFVGVFYGEVQIIEEDLPQRTPRDVFTEIVLVKNTVVEAFTDSSDMDNIMLDNSEAHSKDNFVSALSQHEHRSAIDSASEYDIIDLSSSNNEDNKLDSGENKFGAFEFERKSNEVARHPSVRRSAVVKCNIAIAFWPRWVYDMYDSYALAQKAADMWKRIVGAPSMDSYVKNPGLLSFLIASKIPASESTRQELLEIDEISYRLRRVIELLECCNIRCKMCQGLIGRRSDMLVMSSEGPLSAYVDVHGNVHEVVTLRRANSLVLMGVSEINFSWFPGYAWTIAKCNGCEAHVGWLYAATHRNLQPIAFWGIRCSQVADEAELRRQ